MSDGEKKVEVVVRDREALEKTIELYNRSFKMFLKELDALVDYYEFVWKGLLLVGIYAKRGEWEKAWRKLRMIEDELKEKEREIDWSNEPSML